MLCVYPLNKSEMGLLQRRSKDSKIKWYYWQFLLIITLLIYYYQNTQKAFETLAMFYRIVHNESEPTCRNNQVGYVL